MARNQIKLVQIDNDELLAFLQRSLGLTFGANETNHAFNEIFQGTTSLNNVSITGQASFSQSAILNGFVSNSAIRVHGNISGETLVIDTFNIPSGALTKATVGELNLTTIPIYPSGMASFAVTLPSGTVYGLEQYINNPAFDVDGSSGWMPRIEPPVKVVLLCVSIGS